MKLRSFKCLIAKIFRFLFRFRFFRRHYFGMYEKCFRPWSLFEKLIVQSRIGNGMIMTLDLGEWIQQNIYFFGVWDERTHRFISRHLHSGDVFVDIGANIGYFSLLASGIVGEQGKVIAFEPVSGIYNKLCKHLAVNHCNNAHPYQKAIFEKDTRLKIYLSAGENLGMSGIFHHDLESGLVEEAEAVSLDSFFANLPVKKINIIKIDIEGAELHALRGMAGILRQHRPVLILEITGDLTSRSGSGCSELIGFLEGFHYVCKGIGIEGQAIDPRMTKENVNFAFFPSECVPNLSH